MRKEFVLSLFVSLLTYGCRTEKTVYKWHNIEYKSVKAFSWQNEIVDQEIIVNNAFNPNIKNVHVIELSADQIKKLKKVLTKSDGNKMIAIMECFSPKAGFVFYSELSQPVGWITVDFRCNQLHSNFALEKMHLKEFKNYCKKLGLPIE